MSTEHRRTPPAWVAPFNSLVLRVAGRRFSPFGLVEHRGRRSGRAYHVPVEPFVSSEHVVAALPWGSGTHWVQNVLAAGGCVLRWQGRSLRLTNPRVVGPADALPLTTGVKSRLLVSLRISDFLIFDRWEAGC